MLAFLVLISHMNFFMFIPQLEEVDLVDEKNQPLDDINSLIGLIDQEILGDLHSSPQDEDDDHARYFHIVKIDEYSFHQQVIEVKKPSIASKNKLIYPPYLEQSLASIFFDITSPPPETV